MISFMGGPAADGTCAPSDYHAPPMRATTLERAALGGLALAALIGFLVYPGFPTYDSAYSMVWGREALHLDELSIEAYRAPTQHPLGIALGALLSLFGEAGARMFVLAMLLAFVALVAGVYRLGRDAFTPLVGVAAALAVLSRFDFPYFAYRGFIDIPYVAVLVWAAVLEYQRPRRGGAVFALLAVAGLLRPEAWLLAALYLLWMAVGDRVVGGSPPGGRDLVRWTALAAIGPVLWVAVDFAATGDPLFSFHGSSEVVEELGRSRSVTDLPTAAYNFLKELVKPPVLLAGAAGILLGLWLCPRRIVMPAVLLITGLGTFFAIGAAGLAVIDRYLLPVAAAICIFAGFAAAGFTILRPGAGRTAWIAAASVVVIAAAAFTATRTLQLEGFRSEVAFRTDAYDSLRDALDSEPVQSALDSGCAPVSTPTHKLLPEVRWALDLPESGVVSRSDADERDRTRRGIAIYALGRRTMEREGFDPAADPRTEIPPDGFTRLTLDRYYAVYARCG
jgi:hypothetical protein